MSTFEKADQGRLNDCSVKIAVAVAAAGYYTSMANRYGDVLFKRVFEDRFEVLNRDTEQKAYMKRLRSEEAHAVLKVIWQESDFVPRRVLTTLGKAKRFSNLNLTKNALSSNLCREWNVSDPDEIGAIRTSLARICEAAEVFELIEYGTKVGNKRPLSGTALLHEIMLETHFENARLIRSLQKRSVKNQPKEATS